MKPSLICERQFHNFFRNCDLWERSNLLLGHLWCRPSLLSKISTFPLSLEHKYNPCWTSMLQDLLGQVWTEPGLRLSCPFLLLLLTFVFLLVCKLALKSPQYEVDVGRLPPHTQPTMGFTPKAWPTMTVSAPPYFLPISTPNMGHIAHWPRSGPHQTRSFGLTVSYDGTWAVDSCQIWVTSRSYHGHCSFPFWWAVSGTDLGQSWFIHWHVAKCHRSTWCVGLLNMSDTVFTL